MAASCSWKVSAICTDIVTSSVKYSRNYFGISTEVMTRIMLHYSFADGVAFIIRFCHQFIYNIVKVSIFAMQTCTGLFQLILCAVKPFQIISVINLNVFLQIWPFVPIGNKYVIPVHTHVSWFLQRWLIVYVIL